MPGFFFEPTPPPPPEPKPRVPAESHRDHRLWQDTRPSWNLHLESTGGNVPARFLAESPLAAALVTEDLCWQAATEDWKRRRPLWWRMRRRRRARTAWKIEGAALAAEAERLREMADYVFREL